jgi:hypothetical protein
MSNQPQPALPPIQVAFVIDGEVIDILHTDERLAAIFLSQPTIVDVTNLKDNDGNVKIIQVGDVYNSESGIFSKPEIVQPTEE